MQARSDHLHVANRPIKRDNQGEECDEEGVRLFYYCARFRLIKCVATSALGAKSAWKIHCLTLYLPRFRTEHVSTASRPAGNVTFCIVPSNSGSASNPWRLISGREEKQKLISSWLSSARSPGKRQKGFSSVKSETKRELCCIHPIFIGMKLLKNFQLLGSRFFWDEITPPPSLELSICRLYCEHHLTWAVAVTRQTSRANNEPCEGQIDCATKWLSNAKLFLGFVEPRAGRMRKHG